jgi:CheY-like chemotaxis protein
VTVPDAPTQPETLALPDVPWDNRLKGKRVMVIDNDDAVLDSTAQLLRGWGCQVQTMHAMPESLDMLGVPPDLLLVDMHLDHGDTGVAAAALLRQHLGRAVPTLVMTGDVTVNTRERIAASGLAQVEKPLSALRLRTALTRLLLQG